MNEGEAAKLRANVVRMLDVIGDRARCKGCGMVIWWIKTRAGKRAPYTEQATNHFADCPQAARYRK
jgi:hypothetical protein